MNFRKFLYLLICIKVITLIYIFYVLSTTKLDLLDIPFSIIIIFVPFELFLMAGKVIYEDNKKQKEIKNHFIDRKI